MLTDAAAIVAAYALGSIPIAWLVVRRWAHLDVRRVGSGNVGAANALRATTPAIGLMVALADAAKGAIAVWLARRTHASDGAVALAAVASVVGHVAPIWLRFRGGKGVATASGAFAVLAPIAAAAAHEPMFVKEAAAAVATLIVLKHHANIARLRAGTERSLAF